LDNKFESGLEKINDEMLRYIGVTNLDFRTSLSKRDLDEIQKLIFSINTLMQVTFRDDVGVNDIEDIKHMLELSPMCDDKKIEKLILKKYSPLEVKKLLSMPYMNPDTWNIAYDIKDGTYLLTTLPNYRVMEEYINVVLACVKEDMSQLEKIKEVYDFVKLLEYDKTGSNRIPDIISSRKADSLGFNLLFSEILKRFGIKSYIGEIFRDSKKEYITLIDILDEKYDISGIYTFDPSSDSVDKNLYKSDAIRKINYNFFCLSLDKITDTKENDKLFGVLSLLNSESFDYFDRKLLDRDKKRLEESFGYSYDVLYEKVKKTNVVDDNILLNLFISNIHEEDFLGLNRNVEELLSNNYYLRKKDLFNIKEDNNVNRVNLHDV